MAHIGKVSDVAQMPAVIPAFKTDLDRVIASGCCALVRISIVEDQGCWCCAIRDLVREILLRRADGLLK